MRLPPHHHRDCFPKLQLALPANRMLLADRSKHTLLFVDTEKVFPEGIIAIDTFKLAEWRVLLLLLESYPHLVVYAPLLAVLRNHSPAYSRQQINLARQDDQLRELLRPLRDLVTSLRRRLQPFSLDIAVQHVRGYMIVVLT